MATEDQIAYYQNLLIIQYNGLPRASETIGVTSTPGLLPDFNIQEIQFVNAPASGTFKLSYNGVLTGSLNWNSSAGTIQTALNAILTAPLTVIVSGSIATELVFTFSGEIVAVQYIYVMNNALLDVSSIQVIAIVTPIGDQLPDEIQNAFNVTGSNTAVGNQLDIIGKYVGASRSGIGFSGPITLDDTDFLTLIQIAIIRNRSGSSLATIQALLHEFFPNELFVFDYANMNMSYLINTSIGSQDLIDLFVTEGFLPKPMGVGLSVLTSADITLFFGFITYDGTTNPYGTPFNTYDLYSGTWKWATYDNALAP